MSSRTKFNKIHKKPECYFFHFLTNVCKFLKIAMCKISVHRKPNTGFILSLKLQMLSSSWPAHCCQKNLDKIIEECRKLPVMDRIIVCDKVTRRIDTAESIKTPPNHPKEGSGWIIQSDARNWARDPWLCSELRRHHKNNIYRKRWIMHVPEKREL